MRRGGNGRARARRHQRRIERALALVVCVAVALAVLAAGVSLSSAAPGASPPGSPAVDPAMAIKAQQAMERQETYRRSAAGRDERAASRDAYRSQSADEALATAKGKFRHLVDAPAFEWPELGPRFELKRYLNDNNAIVEDPQGRRAVLESTIPLRGKTPGGTEAPIDLDLLDAGSSLVPRSSPVDVQLPKHADGELRLPGASLGVRLEGARASDARETSNAAFFANALTDTDLVLSPAPRGAELSLVLRSPASLSNPTLKFALAPGDRLEPARGAGPDAAPPGSVEVRHGDDQRAVIAPASAVDAQGQSIAVRYAIDGDRLALNVDDEGDVAWPVAVDPVIYEKDSFGEGMGPGLGGSWSGWHPYWQAGTDSSTASCVAQQFWLCAVSGGQLYVDAVANKTYTWGNYGKWSKKARPGAYIFRVDAADINHAVYTLAPSWRKSGICWLGCTDWAEGSWWPGLGDPAPYGQQGSQAMNFDPDGERAMYEHYCVDVTPNSNGTLNPCTGNWPANDTRALGDEASFQLFMLDGQTGNTNPPFAWLGGAAVYTTDNSAPRLYVPTHTTTTPLTGAPPTTPWVESFNDTVHLHARDNGTSGPGKDLWGVGMGTITVSVAGLTHTDTTGCPQTNPYDLCGPQDWSPPDITYSTPEGKWTYTASASDVVENHDPGQDKTWIVKVDSTEPTVDATGGLEEATDWPITGNSVDLSVSATDENDAGTATSGVQTLEVKITDPVNPVDQVVSQSCAADSCSYEHDFQFDTSRLADGAHTVDVIAKDFVGNTSDETWPITVNRNGTKPYCSDPSADPYGCQPDAPSAVAPTCASGVPSPGTSAGDVVTTDQAVSQARQSWPDAVAGADSISAEALTVAPSFSETPLLGYTAQSVLQPGRAGGSSATYSVGGGASAVCVTPMSTTAAALPPQLQNGAAAVYANTGPSTDTIVRPAPFGIQYIQQLRAATAPETFSYRVSLQPGQYLQQLDDGDVAVVDPTLSKASAALPAPDPSSAPAGANSTTDGTPDGSDDDATDYVEDPADPSDSDIPPPRTQQQYDDEDRGLRSADVDADGQEIAVIAAPWARDATGAPVPADIAVTASDAVSVTIHHHATAYSYPVYTSDKTTTTSARRKKAVPLGLDAQQVRGLTATNNNAQSPKFGDGAPKVLRERNIQRTRIFMEVGVCDAYDAVPNQDLTGSEPASPLTDSKIAAIQDAEQRRRANKCRDTARVVQAATDGAGLDRKLQEYVTIVPDGRHTDLIKPRSSQPESVQPYVNSVERLWQSRPFNRVKDWGATNEPEHHGDLTAGKPTRAAEIWRQLQIRAQQKVNGSARCTGCNILAGEFSRDKTGSSSDSYIRQYMNYLTQRPHRRSPHRWAFHDYRDVECIKPVSTGDEHKNCPKKASAKTFPEFHRFIHNLSAYFSNRRYIRISEAGVRVQRFDGSSTYLKGDLAGQRKAAGKFLRLRAQDHGIEAVYYYAFFGNPPNFDSALVSHPSSDQDPTDPSKPNPLEHFRPTYCVLTNQPPAPCADSGGT